MPNNFTSGLGDCMLNIFFPISFILIAIFSLFLSKSKKNYQKLVESNGEKFAGQVNKGLKVCGYLLLICSIVWLLLDFLF
jgi:uncharacterized membrane protein